MAIGSDATVQLMSLIQPLLLGKKSSTTKSISPEVSAQFNQIFQALSPQLTGQVVSDAELNSLVEATLGKASRAFAPQKTGQANAGAYNSSSQQLLQNDAMAKATQESIAALLNAKLHNAQQQTTAAQIAGGLTANQGQLTGVSKEVTPPALGGLAMPLMAYAGYKLLTGEEGGLDGLFGDGAKKAGGSGAAQPTSPIITNGASSIPGTNVGAGVNFLAGKGSALPDATAINSDALNAIINDGVSGVGASSGITGAAQPLGSLDAMLQKGTVGLSDMGSLLDIPTADIAAPSIGSLTGLEAAPAAEAIAGTSESASGIGSIFEGDMLGDITSGISSAVEAIPGIGPGLVEAGGKVGGTISSINDAFTIDTPIGGVPLLAGVGDLLQGDVKGAAKEIGITMALNAIPGVGPVLNVMRAVSKMCYITTAVTEATGKGDDAYELEILRRYRDDFMLATPAGQELVDNYYAVAPKVVEKLSARSDAKEIYKELYTKYLQPAVVAVEKGDNYGALRIYREMSQTAEAIANAA